MDQIIHPSHIGIINLFLSLLLTSFFLVYYFIFPKRSINYLIVLLLISVLPVWSLFRPGIFHSGDMQTHLAQLINFYTSLSQGILIPRWAGDLCGSLGCPGYAFEYILPYYLGSIFHFIGFSYILSIKLVLAVSFISSGITMYLWAKNEFGKRAGFVAAIFYLFAPYHLIDVHFRGSVGEVLSFVFIPLFFLTTKKYLENKTINYFFLNSLLFTLLLLSHSSTTFAITPIVFGYGLIKLFIQRNITIKSTFLFSLSLS